MQRFVFAAVVLAGCAPWSRIPDPAPTTFPPATRLEIWTAGHPVVVREVTIDADSIRGTRAEPIGIRPDTTVMLARSVVDSFRIRPADRENWLGAGVGAGLLAGIALTFTLFRSLSDN